MPINIANLIPFLSLYDHYFLSINCSCELCGLIFAVLLTSKNSHEIKYPSFISIKIEVVPIIKDLLDHAECYK
jgi:hypothetical protein